MTATTSSPGFPPAAVKERVPFWDNARFLCVTLVVIGHGTQRLTADSNNALIVYLFIYAFHMPAFAVISGYFSRPRAPDRRQMTKVITDIIVPYVIMETIWTFVQFLVEGKQEFNPTKPSWTLWFLLALGIFRLVLPYLALLRYPLLVAVILSIGVGYMNNVDSTFSLSRAIGILPFFVLGWKANEWGWVDRWRAVARHGAAIRACAIIVLVAWLTVVVTNIELWRSIDLRFWFFYEDSYAGLGESEWWAGLVRLGLIALAAILTAAFLVLVPRGETWITDFGRSTMYVYLLHSFLLYPLRETGVLSDEHTSAVWLLSMIFACIAISIALSAPIVRRVFRPIVEPKPGWLFAPTDDEPSPTRGSRRT
ncbi:MAG: fucose 4-O-acetylase [Microbacteriaceae bacterium]|nr:fucose 4-O-acetylase [Microbacteriaceae bacterium]